MLTEADIILSLTRTNRVGYLRDIRRLTVALSRARLGLYILGRRDVFENCFELKEAFQVLFQRPDKLSLVAGEVFPTTRLLGNHAEATEMTSVEHLGQYVFEMAHAKIEALKSGKIMIGAEEVGGQVNGSEDEQIFEKNGLTEEIDEVMEDDSEEEEVEEDINMPQ